MIEAVALGVAFACVACAGKPESLPPAIEAAAEPAWRAALLDERSKHDHEYKTDVTSPLAGVDRFTPEATSYLTLDADAAHLEATKTATTVVTFEKSDAGWSWQPAASITATTADGKHPVAAGAITQPTLVRLSPRFSLVAQTSAAALIIIVFDAQRPVLTAFTGVPYFAPDAHLAVRATLTRLTPPKPLELATSRGLRKPFVEVGTLHFVLAGQQLSLAAYRPAGQPAGELFVPFRDATSGNESYGAARFLDIPEPTDPEAPLVVDFNRAYNPLCALSPAYNCPLPPAGNTLPVAIAAGERDPRLH